VQEYKKLLDNAGLKGNLIWRYIKINNEYDSIQR
jgi:hypothetical protein